LLSRLRGLLRLWLLLRPRLRLRLLLPLGRKMVANRATSRRAHNRMVAGNVTGNSADSRALDAAFGVGSG